jgi:outer membrane biosynthesis protein TonB
MVQPPPPKPKPPEKKPEPPKPSVFDSLLKDLTSRKPAATDEAAKPQPPRPQPQAQPQPPAPRQTASARTPQAFTDQPLTLSELDAIRAQISQCWNVPAGARDAKSLVVDIFVEMNPDGTIRTARIVDQARLYSDAFYRAAAESAMRAVLNPQCSPLRLPREKYDTWKTFTLSFNPKDMLS